jgi:hypothetical protein
MEIFDTLKHNIVLVAMIGEHPELASQIKLEGVSIEKSYCDEVVSRAVEQLLLKGVIVEQGAPKNEKVNHQNRLITLCINAMREIKKFALAAFFDDQEYYNSNYATYARVSGSSETETEEQETEAVVAN